MGGGGERGEGCGLLGGGEEGRGGGRDGESRGAK